MCVCAHVHVCTCVLYVGRALGGSCAPQGKVLTVRPRARDKGKELRQFPAASADALWSRNGRWLSQKFVYSRTHVCMCAHVYVCARVCACMHAHMCTCVHVCVPVCVCVCPGSERGGVQPSAGSSPRLYVPRALGSDHVLFVVIGA